MHYCDFPIHFVLGPRKMSRRRKSGCQLGHVVIALSGDEFYLCILLNNEHSCGKTSHIDMHTINSHTYESHQEMCRQLGTLQDDGVWELALQDAVAMYQCPQIRELLLTQLHFCHPANPYTLLNKHCHEWWDDHAFGSKPTR